MVRRPTDERSELAVWASTTRGAYHSSVDSTKLSCRRRLQRRDAFGSQAIRTASETLVNAAGNFYINDKPTGAVVGLQPFGGARASGTNDKAGSFLNLIRWVSPRIIKETYVPPTDHRYPYMDAE